MNTKQKVHVLHLEDNELDHFLVREMTQGDGLDCDFVAVHTRRDFETALRKQKFDLILSDYSMPSFDGMTGLAISRALAPRTPFIFFSGTLGEDSAVASLRNGAVDYVIKSRPHRLVPAIRRALRDVEEQALLDQTRQRNREQAELLDKATDAILVCNLSNRILYWNQSARRIYGWTAEEVLEKDVIEILFHGQSPTQMSEMTESLERGEDWSGELQQMTRDGKPVIVHSRLTLIHGADGKPKSLLFINSDITGRKHLEEQFLRSQRLESLGVLVSGIAHDLNNALTPILIGVDILRQSPEKENIIKTIESSARRGADMVKQVLAFARGGDAQKVEVKIDSLVKEMGKVIADTFPRNIRCEVKSSDNLWPVLGVPTQLYQVLLNLCVNARDAMPEGGSLTLAAEKVQVDDAMASKNADAVAGDYVCVSVADTGTGIFPEQMEKIFRPFYSTKAPDKGTGLGLSTSLNIIKSHGGFLMVNSVVGQGTEFKFYLPAAIDRVPTVVSPESLPMGNGQGVLVVDDEALVLVLARTALENYRYRVFTAANGIEAISQLNESRHGINVVIANLALPLMSASAMVSAARRINPDIKIIAHGMSKTDVGNSNEGLKIDGFLAKPFTVEKLLTTTHWVLAQK